MLNIDLQLNTYSIIIMRKKQGIKKLQNQMALEFFCITKRLLAAVFLVVIKYFFADVFFDFIFR